MLLFLISESGYAQNIYPVSSKFNSFRQNTVSVMAAGGDTLWIGPSLDYNIHNGADWQHPADTDSIHQAGGRVYSLSIDGKNIAAGLGKNIELNDDDVPSGFGYYLSQDGGDSWQYEPFYFDEEPGNCNPEAEPYDGSCDLPFTYGGETYYRIRNTVAQQSPPYSTSVKGSVILSAAWASGLQRSLDFGHTWEKIILPPMSADSLYPGDNYEWTSNYKGETILRYDPRTDFNLLGFSVLADSRGQVWFGSAGGVNISANALTAPTDSISWKHIRFANKTDGLLGDWIVAIKEDENTGKIWMTNWPNDASRGEQYGLVSTGDNGQNFEQHLAGHKINDIGFRNGIIYAAGETGLFISENDGRTWTKQPQIKSSNAVLKKNTEFFAVAATNSRIWIGTNDGILSSGDDGRSWEINRVDFPLSGGNTYVSGVKKADAYAYPNPYSPVIHEVVRIRFELKKAGKVNIRLFDFGMNLVQNLGEGSYAAGVHETTWDGLDGSGRKAAAGVYFYVIETPGESINGKLLLVE